MSAAHAGAGVGWLRGDRSAQPLAAGFRAIPVQTRLPDLTISAITRKVRWVRFGLPDH